MFPPIGYDSIVTVDSLIYIHDTLNTPESELSFVTDSPCDTLIVFSHEEKKGAKTASISISKGKIKVVCHDDSMQMIINRLNHQLFTTRSKRDVIVKEVVLPVKWYWKALAFLNLVWLIVIATLLFIYERGK